MLWISHLPTASLFLLLLLCFPGQNGGENEQSTDTVSVWEGGSISITCSHSENQVGMHLKTIIQPTNVFYVSEENTYIHPDFKSRLTYSREGSNLKITLHRLQESDSNIYQCSKYILSEGHHKRLNGKVTIIMVKGIAIAPFYTVCFVLQMKKYFQKKKANAVYEDMSYSSRRSTLVRTNTYSMDKSVPAGTEH
uniref:Ig-like domain-containing protein n=1 Tax=Calidris pygmaea TaxID=425635 RepID=A0A8C3PNA3_9CHAR